MPASTVTDHQNVPIRFNAFAQVLQIDVHGFAVCFGHQPAMCLARTRTHRPENVDPIVLSLPQSRCALSPLAPNTGQRALLPEASFVFEPDFKVLSGMSGLMACHEGLEVFLNSAWASRSALG